MFSVNVDALASAFFCSLENVLVIVAKGIKEPGVGKARRIQGQQLSSDRNQF